MERVITEADEGPSDSPILRFHRRREAGRQGGADSSGHAGFVQQHPSGSPRAASGRAPRYPRHLGGTELPNLNYLRDPSSNTTRRGSMNINVCQRGEGGITASPKSLPDKLRGEEP